MGPAPCWSTTRLRSPTDAPALVVDDTMATLERYGAHVVRAWAPRVVAVTGTVGKTGTKELVADALATRFTVFRTPGNYSGRFGLAIALGGLRPEHEVAVVEMATGHFGEIDAMCAMAPPEVGVVTAVDAAHLVALGDVDGVAREKGSLLDHLPADGLAVLAADDERVLGLAPRAAPRRWSPTGRRRMPGTGPSRGRRPRRHHLRLHLRGRRVAPSRPGAVAGSPQRPGRPGRPGRGRPLRGRPCRRRRRRGRAEGVPGRLRPLAGAARCPRPGRHLQRGAALGPRRTGHPGAAAGGVAGGGPRRHGRAGRGQRGPPPPGRGARRPGGRRPGDPGERRRLGGRCRGAGGDAGGPGGDHLHTCRRRRRGPGPYGARHGGAGQGQRLVPDGAGGGGPARRRGRSRGAAGPPGPRLALDPGGRARSSHLVGDRPGRRRAQRGPARRPGRRRRTDGGAQGRRLRARGRPGGPHGAAQRGHLARCGVRARGAGPPTGRDPGPGPGARVHARLAGARARPVSTSPWPCSTGPPPGVSVVRPGPSTRRSPCT